jgi:NTP pyrophosphatase (non-canonical NTP hydrolase)
MRAWVAARQWEKYHLPKNLAASVTIEAGELLELFQWLTPEEVSAKCKDDQFRMAVSEEMCDVLMYLVSLANAMNIDLASAVEHKMQKNEKKYPAEKFQGHYERPLRNT